MASMSSFQVSVALPVVHFFQGLGILKFSWQLLNRFSTHLWASDPKCFPIYHWFCALIKFYDVKRVPYSWVFSLSMLRSILDFWSFCVDLSLRRSCWATWLAVTFAASLLWLGRSQAVWSGSTSFCYFVPCPFSPRIQPISFAWLRLVSSRG